MSSVDAIVRKVTQIFDETAADQVSDFPVELDVAAALELELRKMGFEVRAEPRYADFERTQIVRYVMRIGRGRYGKNHGQIGTTMMSGAPCAA